MELPAAPEWLTRREGALKPGLRDYIAVVMIGGRPEYRLEVRPAQGKFACVVSYQVNGNLIGGTDGTQPTPEAAWAEGLTRLQAKLGW